MTKKTIVVSAVNLVEAGTLTILRDCLGYLSELAATGDYRVVAVVYKQKLADFPHIEYIETQWPKKRWVNRLWFEYRSLMKISKELQPVELWLSLHDTTPHVQARYRAVYCHNAYPFFNWKLRDLFFAPKIVLFALFSRWIYRPNMHKNDYVVVQQKWFKDAMQSMFGLPDSGLVVAPPERAIPQEPINIRAESCYTFFFPASPNVHKNFEVIGKALAILAEQPDLPAYQVMITVDGTENRYAKWLYGRWGDNKNLQFIGFQNKEAMQRLYSRTDCLIFPSRCETWGLPISEFAVYKRPMLLADLPYAHETAEGSDQVAFFKPHDAARLAALMATVIRGEKTALIPVEKRQATGAAAQNWAALFELMLGKTKA